LNPAGAISSFSIVAAWVVLSENVQICTVTPFAYPACFKVLGLVGGSRSP